MIRIQLHFLNISRFREQSIG